MKNIIVRSLTILITVLAIQTAYASEMALSSSIDDPQLKWVPCPPLFPDGCRIAVLHGDPGKPNADILFKIPGGYVIPPHGHTSAERMVLVAGELDVTYEGQPTAHLKKGMYAYGPPLAIHDGKCVSDEECVLFIAFEAPVDVREKQ